MKLNELETKTRILLQGSSSSGKTHQIGTLCRFVPTLVITGDPEGLDTLRKMSVEAEVEVITDWRDMVRQRASIMATLSKVAAVAVDDIGSLQANFRGYIESRPWNWSEERLNGPQLKEKIDRELILGERRFDQARWGQMFVGLDSFFSELFRHGPPIQLYTVLDTTREDPFSGQEKLTANLQGAIRSTLAARCSLILHTYKVTKGDVTEFHASSQPHANVDSKDRYGNGVEWVNPDMATILQHIMAAKKGVPIAL